MSKLLIKAAMVLAVSMAYIQAQAKNVHLTLDNAIVFRGVVTGSSVGAAMDRINELNEQRGSKDYPLYLVLDSPGGSIAAGLDFIEYARSIKNLKTITFFAASMASAIVEALPGERLLVGSGVFMFHRASGGFQGQFESGEVESQLKFAKQMVRSMEVTNSSRMGMSLKIYKNLVVNEYWLFGQNAVSKKAADRVVTVTCSKFLIESKSSSQEMTFFGPVTMEFSGCPLFKTFKIQNEDEQDKYNKLVQLLKGMRNVKIKN